VYKAVVDSRQETKKAKHSYRAALFLVYDLCGILLYFETFYVSESTCTTRVFLMKQKVLLYLILNF